MDSIMEKEGGFFEMQHLLFFRDIFISIFFKVFVMDHLYTEPTFFSMLFFFM